MQPANIQRGALPLEDAPAVTSDHLLLVTKLVPPLARADLLPRPRLVSQLQRGVQRPVTLLAAPAGFGKTTLLSSWLEHASLPAAWITLEPDDDDLTRFWFYLITAVSRIHPGSGASALPLLQPSALSSPSIEIVLTAWINTLAALPHEIALVLDDYHVITGQPIHHSVSYLLDHLPHQLHLILATRADPPLPLTRLRTRGQLTEVRAADLRFTAEETAAFLTRELGQALSDADIAILETRTEGWIAGLQLAALSMHAHEDIAGFLKAFTGSHRYVIDYLVEEVLARQPASVQTFLLQTAILERLQASLCDAVLGAPRELSGVTNGQMMLDQLEQANLFLTPLDDERRWYRYHQLFAEALRHRLRLTLPALVPELHRRASGWYEQHGLPRDAIYHALAAADYALAVRLIEHAADSLVKHGELATLRTWLEALPAELVQSRMELCFWRGWLLTQTGQFDAAERWLQEIEHHLHSSRVGPPLAASGSTEQTPQLDDPQRLRTHVGRVAALRAYIAFRRGDARGTIALARQALDQFQEDQIARGMVAWYLGIAHMWNGDMVAGAAALTEAIGISQAEGNRYVACMASFELAKTQVRQGHLHQSDQSYQQAFDAFAERSAHFAATGPLYVGRGDLQREWNQLNTAAHSLREGIAQCQQTGNTPILLAGYIALAQVRQAQGDNVGADMLISQIAQLLRTASLAPLNAAQVAAWHARLLLAQGDVTLAARWVQEWQVRADDALSPPREIAYHTLARLLLAQHRPDAALPLIARLLALAEQQGRTGNALEHLVLLALVQQARGHETEAQASLARALSLAQPEGYIRLFLDEGAPMAHLLARLPARQLGDQPALARYHNQLLALLGGAHAADMSHGPMTAPSPNLYALEEPLSEREVSVLRLIAAGCSNREIADQLVIAVSTVKWYVNSINGKLQVTSRTKAVARARELHLVD